MKRIQHSVFWPIFILMLVVTGYSLGNTNGFIQLTTKINTWILSTFGELISVSVLVFLSLSIIAYFSPLGKNKIGGQEASPLLTKWRWFSITLCTTIATGILFWGTAEPLFHLHEPPPGLGLEPNSSAAIGFSISTMYLHWTFIPYGIYTMAGLAFAWSYYNLKQPFTLGAMIYPAIGERAIGPIGKVVDAISLFSLIAGMAASLGAGLIILAGGLETLAGIKYSYLTLGLMAVLIVGTFILSSISGLQKGIKTLSDINIKIFIGLAIFIFVFGPTLFILKWGFIGIWEFISHFFSRSLIGFTEEGKAWSQGWTVFYWSNWLAWTPITALFLGKIAKGYTVREFIRFNLIYPSLFGMVWMMIFSNTSIYYNTITEAAPLFNVLNSEGGVSKVIFSTLGNLPLSQLTSFVFLVAAFLSYVTAADSNTTAMSGISSKSINDDEPYLWMKVIWGVLIGTIAWVMISFSGDAETSGLDGIKMLSNLGGLPALFLMLVVAVGMVRLIWKSY
ncbi:MAG: BCCT family transporter [Cyclobacteriaceae bacterium]|nr:BCCT family transporter [Cyclobacteriaceae bacterium]